MHPSRCTVSPLKKMMYPQQIYISFYTQHKPCLEHSTMSLDQYNRLMSDILNKRHVLVKLRAELEGRLCRCCGRFGYLTWKCRSGERQKKKKTVGENRFEVLKSCVVQCGVREVRRQEEVEERARCFKCEEEGHKKWECPKREKRRRKEKAVPKREIWEKVKKHSRAIGLPPRGAVMSMEGWTT